MILEQDLGDKTLLKLLSACHSEEEEFEIYKSVLNIMIKIHKIKPSSYKSEGFTQLFLIEKSLWRRLTSL